MAKRSLVYSIIFDGAKAAAGARKVSQESKGLSKSLTGVKTSSLDVKEALLKVERAQAGASRAIKRYGEDSIQARSASVRLERAQHNLTNAQEKLTHAQDQTNRSTHRLSGSLKTAAKMAATAGAAYVGISQVKDAITTTEELGKTTLVLSKNFGLSVKTASELAAVMRARGADANKLSMSFKTLSTQVFQASHGSKQAAQTFAALGISQKDLQRNGKDTDWVLRAVSDGLGNMKAGTDKAALASRLFGRSWKDLAPLIRDGSGALNEQLAVAEKYGVTFNGKTIKSVHELAAAQREQRLAVMGLQLALGTTLVPALTKVIGTINQLVLSVRRDWPQIQRVIEPVVKAIGTAVSSSVAFVSGLIRKNRGDISAFGQAMANVGKGIALVFNGYLLPTLRMVLPALKQQLDGFARVVRGTVRIISGLLTLDFRRAWAGVQDLFSGSIKIVIGMTRAMTAPIRQSVVLAGRAIGAGFRAAWAGAKGIVGDGVDAVVGVIRGGARRIGSAAGAVASAVADAFKGLGSRILRGLGSAAGFARSVANAVIQLLNDAIPNSIGPINVPDNPIPRVAQGGKITGGTPGKDSVLALLMPGEHVLTTQEVKAAGGHDAIYRMRRRLGGGGQSRGMAFREGGVVGRMQSAAWGIARRGLPYTYGGGHGRLGVGNPGFDCSGYVSAILGAGGVISSPMAVREPLASNLAPAKGPNDGPVVVGIRGSSGRNAHTMIRVGESYYESGSGHGPRKVGGWSGSFQWFKPRKFGAGGTGKRWGNKKQYGATVFTDKAGYKGDNLYQYSDTWAELGNGKALGGLPYGAKIRVTVGNGKSMVLVKRDVGAGGGPIRGHKRAVDIHITALRKLGINDTNWSGVVEVEVLHAVDGRAARLERIRTRARRLAKQRRAERRKAKRITDANRETNIGRLQSLYEDPLEGNYLSASLTPGTDDDIATAQAGLSYWTGRANMAQAAWNQGLLTDPDVFSSIIGERDKWQGRVDDLKPQKQEPPVDNSAEILAELRRMNARAEYIGNTADGALARAVTAVVSGQIGGRVGLGFATPSYAGAYARY